MPDISVDSLEGLSPTELVGLLRRVLSELERERAEKLDLKSAFLEQRREIEQLKDEVRRLKNLPPRPPIKPSGMEKATPSSGAEAATKNEGTTPRRRGPGVSKLKIDRQMTLAAAAPEGSRRKGFEDIIVQDVRFGPLTTLYRRERWETPDGRTIVAELPPGVIGGCGPHLHRLVLMLHFQGQMTCERIVTLLNASGVSISKRQVVRLLTAKLEIFQAEDNAVFEAGLRGSAYITVDDTGARHAGKAAFTTQFGSPRFTAFRTGPSKSRLAFLRNLMCGTARYVINAAALAYMRAASLAHGVIDALQGAEQRDFAGSAPWMAHLCALGLTEMRVQPDPVRVASEAALWGAIQAEGLLAGAVIVSDDAGQFRVGEHALCWVHAERLAHKLLPANAPQRNSVEVTRRMIWWLYRRLKAYKLAPTPDEAVDLAALFDRIFRRKFRRKTGYATLDNLLKRLRGRKEELLRVLKRPEIPLNTNASENDIRSVVTKRKISGGTISEKGRNARDVMLGLAKTCAKLGLSFFDYIGDRLGLPGPKIPPLASLVNPAPS
jgi:hypothetical protein